MPRSRRRTRRRPRVGGVQTVSRPFRAVATSPAARRRPRCQLTSGCDRPTCVDQLGDRGRCRRPGGGRSAGGSRRRGPCGTRAARAGRRAGRRRSRSWCGCGRGRGTGRDLAGDRINGGLYQWGLMLGASVRRCQVDCRCAGSCGSVVHMEFQRAEPGVSRGQLASRTFLTIGFEPTVGRVAPQRFQIAPKSRSRRPFAGHLERRTHRATPTRRTAAEEQS